MWGCDRVFPMLGLADTQIWILGLQVVWSEEDSYPKQTENGQIGCLGPPTDWSKVATFGAALPREDQS